MTKMRSADDQFFQKLVEQQDPPAPTPGRLKSRIYSALVQESQKQSPLRGLAETRNAGYELCAWEKIVRVAPAAGRLNHCHLCHARFLAEVLEEAPLSWSGCPYARFHKR